jgi:hypothetical protein
MRVLWIPEIRKLIIPKISAEEKRRGMGKSL